MHGLLAIIFALLCAAIWLVLLEVTSFNAITMGCGVLVGLEILSRNRRATR
jgi:hypothetical protein